MKATVKITCKACGCSMELETTRWKRSDAVVCQNCGQRMDSHSLSLLNEALKAIQDVPDITSEDGFMPSDRGFCLELIPFSEE